MSASELIGHLKQFGETKGGYECWDHQLMREAATMLERYLALADELENTERTDETSAYGVFIAKRIREIAEG